MSAQRRTAGWPPTLAAGLIVGAVESVLAISLAALVFAGYLKSFLAEGIGLYLGAAVLTLTLIAWRAGSRGPVGSVQKATAAVLGIVATAAAVTSFGSVNRGFLSVVAATLVVTVSVESSSSCSGYAGWVTSSGSCRTRWSADSSSARGGCS